MPPDNPSEERQNSLFNALGPKLILASASRSRADLLACAGLRAQQLPARVDEGEIKAAMRESGGSARETAQALADLKARRVSQNQGAALVIGADQMLSCAGQWFDKPADLAHAKAHLMALGGKTHELHSAVCVYQNGASIWHHQETARMTMRVLSDGFIDDYLAAVGDDALSSVGAYQVEGFGMQLFSRIDGDYFAIRGLPLFPLLSLLREHRVIGT